MQHDLQVRSCTYHYQITIVCIIHTSCECLEIFKSDDQKFGDFYSVFALLWGWGGGGAQEKCESIPFVMKIGMVL